MSSDRKGTPFGPGVRAVLVVEGDGDRASLQLAAEVSRRPDLLQGITILPLEGTAKLQRAYVAHADAERAGLGILALFDSDGPGKKAFDELGKRGFTKRQLMQYADVFDDPSPRQFPYEAEDLWDPMLIEMFGRWYDSDRQTFSNGHRHYDLSQAQKIQFNDFLRRAATAAHASRWIRLMEMIRERLELDNQPTDDDGGTAPAGTAIRDGSNKRRDAYDDKDQWSYTRVRTLARDRGHRFRGRPTRERVLEVLRQQDADGWVFGELAHISRGRPQDVAASRPTSDPDIERIQRELRSYLDDRVCAECQRASEPLHEACTRAIRLGQLRAEDRADLADYLMGRQCSVCRNAEEPVHPPCRVARRHLDQLALVRS